MNAQSDMQGTQLAALFEAFDQNALPYVVLRGYTPISELKTSADIDVFIHPRDKPRAEEIIRSCGWLKRAHQAGRYPHQFYDRLGVDGAWCKMLDVVYGIYYGDELFELRNADAVLRDTRRIENVSVPHPWIAVFLFGLHVCLDKGRLSSANRERGERMAAEARAESDSPDVVSRAFGADCGELAREFVAFFASGTADQEQRLATLIERARQLDALSVSPVRARIDRVQARWSRTRSRPVRIAVLGMDGAGKGTLIAHMVSATFPLPASSGYLGFNEFLTPPFKWVLNRIAALTAAGKGESIQLRLLDKIREALWPGELFARMYRAEAGRLIVFYDRYPFPATERGAPLRGPLAPASLAYEWTWTRLLPRADVLFLLDGDPQVIWDRKREYPFEVFVETRKRLLQLFDQFPREKFVIRTDGSLSESKAGVEQALLASRQVRLHLYGADSDGREES